MPYITIGQGAKRPQGQRTFVADIGELRTLLHSMNEVESWWSGHLWASDYRNNANWEGAEILLLDVDYCDDSSQHEKRHSIPPLDKVEALKVVDMPCSCWHLTPRGIRIAFFLDQMVVDSETMKEAIRGASQIVSQHLSQIGVAALKDGRNKFKHGYAVDVKAIDLAHFMFGPRAEVHGAMRTGTVWDGSQAVWEVEALRSFVGRRNPAADAEGIAAELAKMDAGGANDGTGNLKRVTSQAVRLGVKTVEEFLEVSEAWNAKNEKPFDETKLAKEFADSQRWFVDTGRIPIKDKSRAAVDLVLRTDNKYKGLLRYNKRKHTYWFGDDAMEPKHFTDVSVDLSSRYSLEIQTRQLKEMMESICKDNQFDPVEDYLLGLTWDGEPRIDRVPREILGAMGSELEVKYFRRWLISGVARALNWGEKVDAMLVLAGEMGGSKSTFFNVLAGDENFSSSDLPQNKDAYHIIQGLWIFEFGELEHYTGPKSLQWLKRFLTDRVDRYRPSHMPYVGEYPRSVIFGASTNSDHPFQMEDEGNRRFLIIETGDNIDINLLKVWRDQLWAEASAALAAGEQFWFDREDIKEIKELNELYKVQSPNEERLANALATIESNPNYEGWTTLQQLAEKFARHVYGGAMPREIPLGLSKEIGRVLRIAGYVKRNKNMDGRQKKIWIKKDSEFAQLSGVSAYQFEADGDDSM